ncbi:Calcium-dependent secretion activator [Portunus trituberculatus]|uniref:Calcium-dependent secretion activator n=1 Tax=Portunus trituberculatus TaxID=210409 RepID=A0A5B7FP66_PORTR|nr:Calcium-dependent secretion activator [Portunus trituberculatus]
MVTGTPHDVPWKQGSGRYCFPFGRPEGALKATLSLLERVLMKDIVTPVPPEEVRGMIKKCLENAALLNYTRLSAETRIEGLLLIITIAV